MNPPNDKARRRRLSQKALTGLVLLALNPEGEQILFDELDPDYLRQTYRWTSYELQAVESARIVLTQRAEYMAELLIKRAVEEKGANP